MAAFTTVLSLMGLLATSLAGLLVITLAILVPLVGAVVRLRAHYNPKGLQLSPEGDVQPHTGPVITSLFAMLVRVYRIEGWPGLYKGLMPILSISMVTLFMLLVLGYNNLRHGTFNAPSIGVPEMLTYTSFAMLIVLPLTIIADRAITTPHKLPYFDAIYSLRMLLTPTERRRPWILYLTPGLLAAQVSHIACIIFGLRAIWQLFLPDFAQPDLPSKEDVVVKLAISLVLAVASTVVLTPLEIITIKLAIQRNHAAHEFNSISREEGGGTEKPVEYAGIGDDVISLRTDREPYTGLVDCAKKIIDEEGWSALYRAWWLT